MPRTARASVGGYCYHVIYRGNARSEVFHKEGDYRAFVDALGEANVRLPMRLLGYCLMPNPFHLVLRPRGDGDLGRWMHGLLTTQVRRYLRHAQHTGHVWQGRFQGFPIQEDDHLVTVLRYVERDPWRARLVTRAEAWPWSSLGAGAAGPRLDTGPTPQDPDWLEFVNAPMTQAEVDAVRLSIRRDRPFGDDSWTRTTAVRLGRESSLRNRGHQPAVTPSEARAPTQPA
jgi:putative transposase